MVFFFLDATHMIKRDMEGLRNENENENDECKAKSETQKRIFDKDIERKKQEIKKKENVFH